MSKGNESSSELTDLAAMLSQPAIAPVAQSTRVRDNLSVGMADNCSQFYTKLTECLKPKYQFSSYHRTGEMEYCPSHFDDWMICARAKLTPGAEKKEKLMMNTTHYKQKVEDAARKAPWDSKDPPEWANAR